MGCVTVIVLFLTPDAVPCRCSFLSLVLETVGIGVLLMQSAWRMCLLESCVVSVV